ncbi:MAG: glutathione S-transferase N-terminal domain-containing protein [Geminicoccaceae bacterium]
MILVGQYDSPFVRRVAISLLQLGLPFERAPLSVFGDAAAMRAHNPLGRVPALVLDCGETLIDSAAILDWLDDKVGPERALVPAHGSPRRLAMQRLALAGGTADKLVQLTYERKLRPAALRWPDWLTRLTGQVEAGLAAIEAETAELAQAPLDQVAITVACLWRFAQITHPDLLPAGRYPGLERHSAACEALPPFKATWPSALVFPGTG